ncbi:MAG: response regulator, partial [Candidatus Methylomirabilales bacterium]
MTAKDLASQEVTSTQATRILVVDDEHSIRTLYADLFSDAGFQVTDVSGAKEALSLLDDAPPDVILLDLLMPGMDGLTALDYIRVKAPDVPVIILTAHPTSENAIQALKKGAYDFLTKGSHYAEAVQAVRRALQHRCLLLHNRELIASLQQRVEELTAISDVSSLIGSTLDLEATLDQVTKKTQQLFRSEAASILITDEKTGELCFYVVCGERADRVRPIRLQRGEGIAGWVLEHGKPLLVPDAHADPRFSARVDEVTQMRTRSLVCAPVCVKGRPIGVLEVLNRLDGRPFSFRDLNLLIAVCAQVGIAVDSARLYSDMTRR